ncbi:MAG: adenylate/guanylate cyclase domain-containing protein [Acidobacteriota bacterium]
MEKKRSGIRTRFITILILITIIPLIITGYILTTINEQAIKLQLREFQLSLSIQLTDITHSILNNSCSELNEISSLLNDKQLTSDQVIRLSKYKILNSRNLDLVNIYNKNGTFLDSMIPSGLKAEIDESEKIDQKILEIIDNSNCIPGDVEIKNKKVLLQIYKTWKAGERIQGYFGAVTGISDLSIQLEKIIHSRSFPRFYSAYIIDKEFNVIADSRWRGIPEKKNLKMDKFFRNIFKDDLLLNKNIAVAFDFNDGKQNWVINISTIPRFNWLLITTQKKESAYQSLYSMQKKILILALIFVFAAVIIGTLFGRHLSAPIMKIAAGARKFADKEFTHRIKAVNSKDEIGEVADAFNFLGESLEEYDSRIKKEVAIRSDLSRYLAPELVDAVISRKANLNLGGRKENVVVLFADVAGFTSISESKPPEQIVSLLNELFTILSGIIFRNNGMIDKFIGDSVMALFGVPDPYPDAVNDAVKASREMLTWLEVGNKKWQKEFGITIELAISINYGKAIIGNIGSEKRMEFTAIGSVVNTAARIEKIAQRNQILITKAVYEKISDKKLVKPVGNFKLQGYNQNIDLFEILK